MTAGITLTITATNPEALSAESLPVNTILSNDGPEILTLQMGPVSPIVYEIISPADGDVLFVRSAETHLTNLMSARAKPPPPVESVDVDPGGSIEFDDDPPSYDPEPLPPGSYELVATCVIPDGTSTTTIRSQPLPIVILEPNLYRVASVYDPYQVTMGSAVAHADPDENTLIMQRDTETQRADDGVFFTRTRFEGLVQGLATSVHTAPELNGRWVAWLQDGSIGGLLGWANAVLTTVEPVAVELENPELIEAGFQIPLDDEAPQEDEEGEDEDEEEQDDLAFLMSMDAGEDEIEDRGDPDLDDDRRLQAEMVSKDDEPDDEPEEAEEAEEADSDDSGADEPPSDDEEGAEPNPWINSRGLFIVVGRRDETTFVQFFTLGAQGIVPGTITALCDGVPDRVVARCTPTTSTIHVAWALTDDTGTKFYAHEFRDNGVLREPEARLLVEVRAPLVTMELEPLGLSALAFIHALLGPSTIEEPVARGMEYLRIPLHSEIIPPERFAFVAPDDPQATFAISGMETGDLLVIAHKRDVLLRLSAQVGGNWSTLRRDLSEATLLSLETSTRGYWCAQWVQPAVGLRYEPDPAYSHGE